jgi:hypothetical protein
MSKQTQNDISTTEKKKKCVQPVQIKVPPKPPQSKNLRGMKAIHEFLPQIPFYVGIIGPRHCGKTVMLYNLLGPESGMYGDAFKKTNIVFYSPTKDKDDTLRALNLKWVYGPPTDPGVVIAHLQDMQKAYSEADNMTGILIAFDDITQVRDAWRPLEQLSYSGRHDHIHILYVCHKMSSIPRGVRTQTQQWIIYKPHEESERQWIMEMFARKRTWDIWESALTRCWKILHNFVYIDFERKELHEIYRSGFNEPFFTPQEIAFLEGDGSVYKNLGLDIPEDSVEEEKKDYDPPHEDETPLPKRRKKNKVPK